MDTNNDTQAQSAKRADLKQRYDILAASRRWLPRIAERVKAMTPADAIAGCTAMTMLHVADQMCEVALEQAAEESRTIDERIQIVRKTHSRVYCWLVAAALIMPGSLGARRAAAQELMERGQCGGIAGKEVDLPLLMGLIHVPGRKTGQ